MDTNLHTYVHTPTYVYSAHDTVLTDSRYFCIKRSPYHVFISFLFGAISVRMESVFFVRPIDDSYDYLSSFVPRKSLSMRPMQFANAVELNALRMRCVYYAGTSISRRN